jgi:hypothetical protein
MPWAFRCITIGLLMKCSLRLKFEANMSLVAVSHRVTHGKESTRGGMVPGLQLSRIQPWFLTIGYRQSM